MAAPTGRATVLRKLGKVTRIKREQDASVPPGQFATEKFPVMTYGPTPNVDHVRVAVQDVGAGRA